MLLIKIFIQFLDFYFLIGFLFGTYFGVKGAKKLDNKIKDSKWTVNLLLVPGAIAIWPILLFKIIFKIEEND